MSHSNIALFVPHAGCPHMCAFCNQKTISGKLTPLTPEEVSETLAFAAKAGLKPGDTEIAFFGGSFTAIDRDYMISLLEETVPFINSGVFSGIRISTRPDAISGEILDILKKYGVTVIELGAQSTSSEVLELSRRGHTREDIFNAASLIKKYGFTLGLQMMTGLPGDTPEKAMNTANDFVELKADCVRIYPTIVLEGTELCERYRNGTYIPQTVDEAVALCAGLLEIFRKADIPVIRLGLHSGGNVEDGYVAGPFHPAFGEKCESYIFYKKALSLINSAGSRKIRLIVNSRDLSKMIGQGGENRKKLQSDGAEIIISADNSVPEKEIILEEITETENK